MRQPSWFFKSRELFFSCMYPPKKKHWPPLHHPLQKKSWLEVNMIYYFFLIASNTYLQGTWQKNCKNLCLEYKKHQQKNQFHISFDQSFEELLQRLQSHRLQSRGLFQRQFNNINDKFYNRLVQIQVSWKRIKKTKQI